jgi:hypothetical protein
VLKIVIQPNPVKLEKFIHECPLGSSLQDIYNSANLRVPIEACTFIINDEISTDYNYCPTENDIVSIKTLPAGDDALAITGGILLGVTTFFILASVIAPTIAVVIALSLGFFAYFSKVGVPTKQTYSFQGKTNEEEQYNIVPVLYGTTKYTPSYGASDYTEIDYLDDDPNKNITDVWLRQLYVLGYKPTIVEKINIGDNTVISRTRVDGETLTILQATGAISTSGDFLDGDGNRIFSTGSRIILHDGLNYGEHIVTQVVDDDTIICGDATFSDETTIIEYSYLSVDQSVYSIEFELIDDGDFSNTNYPSVVVESSVNKLCSYNTPVYYTTPTNVKEVDIEVGFLSGLAKVKSNNNLDPLSVEYKIEAKQRNSRDWTTLQTYTANGKQREEYRETHTYDFSAIFSGVVRGEFDIRITRLTPHGDDAKNIDALTFVSARNYKVDDSGAPIPPIDEETAGNLLCLTVKVKAGPNISGTINNLTVEATRWTHAYMGSDTDNDDQDEWEVRETHNPASMFLDILRNDLLAQHPVTNAMIDWPAIQEWYNWCEDNEYTCNGILLEETTIQEELQKVCGVGRAEFCLIDGKYTVNQKIEKDTAVQMFSSRNIVKDSFAVTRSFEDIPDGVSLQFINKDAGYILDEIQLNEEYTTTTNLNLVYVDNHIQAQRLGQIYLNALNLQILNYQFGATLDALIATRGDKIILQHDAALLALASGRITQVTRNAYNRITSITVDEACYFEDGVSYGVTIRTNTDILSAVPINGNTDGYYTVFTITTPFVDNDIVAGNLFIFGDRSVDTVECIITDIQYSPKGHATITALEYSDALYDLSGIPEWHSSITRQPHARGITTSRDLDEVATELTERQGLVPYRVFQELPVPPYDTGDMWIDGVRMYDCVQEKELAELFSSEDWHLRASSTFDILNKDTFNVPNPKQRWHQIPGGGVPYNLLTTTEFTASSDSDPASKSNILELDDVDWEPPDTIASITVDGISVSKTTTTGSFDSAYIMGRYANNGYMGEGFTNLLVNPKNPVTQDVDVVAGQVVIQCYRGTITCTYGEASYGNPLIFDSLGETLTLTISADCWYGSVTNTDFIPPYYAGEFTDTDESLTLTGSTLNLRVKIVNIPSADTYSICHIYGDVDNYIKIFLYDEMMHMEIACGGKNITEAIAVNAGIYDIDIDWSDTVQIDIDNVPYVFTEVGYVYGFSTHAYGFNSSKYGYGDDPIDYSAVTMDTADIGEGFNNTILEIEYE